MAEERRPLRVLVVASEVAPFAKTGGLADVVGSLPKALRRLGLDVRVVTPLYAGMDWHALERLDGSLEVPMWWGPARAAVRLGRLPASDVPIYFLEYHRYFDRPYLYGPHGGEYEDNLERFTFLSRGALELAKALNFLPDVVHANDWQTALIPVLMREGQDATWDEVASIFTIHNLAYQGVFGSDVLDYAGLSQSLFIPQRLETFGKFNFLKAGCVYADKVNTVSPTYAEEILTEEYGCTLWGLLRYLKKLDRFTGILNGIDLLEFNPATDAAIAHNYDADHPDGKAVCRAELLREIGMDPIPGAPLAGVVSRLSEQKGMDLMLAALDRIIDLPMQLFVQGVGDPWLADQFDAAVKKHPHHVRFAQRFDIVLGQKAYAGCDLFLMPSAFEPCGLGQMIAMRYGTVPVVRRTGGLADTVFDGQNGFVHEAKTADAFVEALVRAKAAYDDYGVWHEIRNRAFRSDYGWRKSARVYESMFAEVLTARAASVARAAGYRV